MPHRLLLAAASVVCTLVSVTSAGAASHPLDSLDASEIARAVDALRAAGHADDRTVYASITLLPPAKDAVLAWKPGDPFPRTALAVLRHDAKTYEATVDVASGTVVAIREVPGAQPTVMLPEILAAIEVATADPRMQAGLRKRGIEDASALFCAPRTVGNFGRDEERTRRLAKVDCFDSRETKTDVFANPIEGLFATVDLDRREVLSVTDLGVVPIPSGDTELDPVSLAPLRPVNPVVQATPEGSNIRLDGWTVHWQKWSFHLSWESRAGLVISQVRYDADGGPRSVLYQGSIAEIFVPYQDPTEGWYYRTYLDQSDYGFGATSSPLAPGADCPPGAVYLSPVMANAGGGAETLDNRVCLFERAPGEPVWRHFDIITQALEARPAIELVARFIATVGNYDYLVDWVLDQRGNLTFRAGATGIDGVKGVAAQRADAPGAADDTAYGPLISPGRVGVNHDHFFSIRLDVDVDGTANSFVRDMMVPERQPAASPRTSIWRVQPSVAMTDTESRYRLNFERPALWRVINPGKRNGLGYPVGFALRPSGNALPLVDEDDPALGRALFASQHLWVTPYDPAERYAAGDYPNQAAPGAGLPAWTANHRSVENRDIVLWYTLGFHHIPSAEDWPVYNLGWHSLTLRPYNFFDRNPAADVPPVGETTQ